jgi:CMP-2-keto-3-deoxyoctulosonic acid synthetase
MSRSKIPSIIHSEDQTEFWKQICVFGFTWKSMKKFYEDTLPGKLEAAESIEMLRAIESSFNFKLLKSDVKMCSVDTVEDLKFVETLMKNDPLYLKGY